MKLLPLGICFFAFLALMHIATGLLGGPITAVNYIPYKVWLISLTVSLKFTTDRPLLATYQKFGNYNTTRLVLAKCGFSGSRNLTVSLKFATDQPLLPW